MSAPRRTEEQGFEVVTIGAADGVSRMSFVPALGGIGSSLVLPASAGPRERLFRHDFFWQPKSEKTRGGWPFLFPANGRLERDGEPGVWLHRGRRLSMFSHGFSLRVPWEALETGGADELTLRLTDSPFTRERYPFAFEIRLRYRIAPGRLTCDQWYYNPGDEPLPYTAGFHPYFLTPPAGAGKEAVTLELESRRTWRYNPRQSDIIGTAPPLTFPRSVSDPEINESLNEVDPGHAPRLRSGPDDALAIAVSGRRDPRMFPFVQLYTIPEKPFFCIEPWMSPPNALNALSGMRWLEPGGAELAVLTLWTEAGEAPVTPAPA